MVAWVNLHLGFVAGLAICAAYVLLEVLDLPFAAKRPAALARLRRAWRWLVLTGAATLVNPWGASVYSALIRQERAQSLHTSWIVEWGSVRPSWASLHQALDWRDPQSSFWWLIFIVLLSACVAIWRNRWGAAVLLITSAYLTIQHVRLQALFACIAVVVGGAIFDELRNQHLRNDGLPHADATDPQSRPEVSQSAGRPAQFVTAAVLLVTTAVAGLAAARSRDLISNRYYMRSTHLSLFGTGISWWFPGRAVEFLHRQPGNTIRFTTLLSRLRPERGTSRLAGMAAGSRCSRYQYHHCSTGSLSRDDTIPAAPLLLSKPVMAARVRG
jgi:hypothetical protein